jgi:hypothetical protein
MQERYHRNYHREVVQESYYIIVVCVGVFPCVFMSFNSTSRRPIVIYVLRITIYRPVVVQSSVSSWYYRRRFVLCCDNDSLQENAI